MKKRCLAYFDNENIDIVFHSFLKDLLELLLFSYRNDKGYAKEKHLLIFLLQKQNQRMLARTFTPLLEFDYKDVHRVL